MGVCGDITTACRLVRVVSIVDTSFGVRVQVSES
jgi:hypothetical protein